MVMKPREALRKARRYSPSRALQADMVHLSDVINLGFAKGLRRRYYTDHTGRIRRTPGMKPIIKKGLRA